MRIRGGLRSWTGGWMYVWSARIEGSLRGMGRCEALGLANWRVAYILRGVREE